MIAKRSRNLFCCFQNSLQVEEIGRRCPEEASYTFGKSDPIALHRTCLRAIFNFVGKKSRKMLNPPTHLVTLPPHSYRIQSLASKNLTHRYGMFQNDSVGKMDIFSRLYKGHQAALSKDQCTLGRTLKVIRSNTFKNAAFETFEVSFFHRRVSQHVLGQVLAPHHYTCQKPLASATTIAA